MATVARLVEVGDLLAASIGRHLKQSSPLSRCERKWFINVKRETLQAWKTAVRTFTCYVIPTMVDSELETRGNDIGVYQFGLIFVEHYADQGDPDEDWVDLRIQRCADVVNTFSELREPLDGLDLRAEVGRFTSLLETDILLEEKTFWAEAEFEFRESIYA